MGSSRQWLGIPLARWIFGVILALVTVGIFACSIWVSSRRETTPLENVLLQMFGILSGVGFSWVLADAAGRTAATQALHARAIPAFRRVVRLYEAHGRVIAQVDELSDQLHSRAIDGKVEIETVALALNTIQVQIFEQVGTANDAMEDWRDLAPDEVDRLERKAVSQEKRGKHGGLS